MEIVFYVLEFVSKPYFVIGHDHETRMTSAQQSPNRAVTSAYLTQHAIKDRSNNISSQGDETSATQTTPRPPRPGATRLASTRNDRPYDVSQFVREIKEQDGPDNEETVLYLAYGSNLSSAKFKGDRGIKPLSQLNVVVPTLRMTFDLPGIAYTEPCFANSAVREPENDHPKDNDKGQNEKTALLKNTRDGLRRDQWHKGLVGVVYEVTAADYAHIIATEGGGASYKDILVDCYPLPTQAPWDPVPEYPDTKPFKAHTLFAPALPPGEDPPKDGGRFQRPKTDYAQPSARYLKLITDGAKECELPYEYQDYLQNLRPFTITTTRQRLGQGAFLAVWAPIVLFLFGLGKIFADEDGIMPKWLAGLFGAVFKAAWGSYDAFYKPVFGEGERTLGDEDEEARWRIRVGVKRDVDVEKCGPDDTR